MISSVSKRLVADSNVLLSAVIGKGALKVFLAGEFDVLATAYNMDEVLEYIPFMARKYGLSQRHLLLQLRMLPIKVFKENHYKSMIPVAGKALAERDPDDVHPAALALKEKVLLWSNDRDLAVVPGVTTVTTTKLLSSLGL